MNDNISWVFELTLKNGKLDELKNVMTEISENTYKEEPQTLNYGALVKMKKNAIYTNDMPILMQQFSTCKNSSTRTLPKLWH